MSDSTPVLSTATAGADAGVRSAAGDENRSQVSYQREVASRRAVLVQRGVVVQFGDLTRCFSSYFATTVGSNRESVSYTAIGVTVRLLPDSM